MQNYDRLTIKLSSAKWNNDVSAAKTVCSKHSKYSSCTWIALYSSQCQIRCNRHNYVHYNYQHIWYIYYCITDVACFKCEYINKETCVYCHLFTGCNKHIILSFYRSICKIWKLLNLLKIGYIYRYLQSGCIWWLITGSTWKHKQYEISILLNFELRTRQFITMYNFQRLGRNKYGGNCLLIPLAGHWTGLIYPSNGCCISNGHGGKKFSGQGLAVYAMGKSQYFILLIHFLVKAIL